MNHSVLTLDQVGVTVAGRTLISSLSLSLTAGSTGCLVGPSGCGKTTLLRAIAGLGSISAGEISIAGDRVASTAVQLPPERRGIGLVFQDLALFPHLSVTDNVGFGLQRWSKADRVARIREVLALVGLHGMEQRWPHQMSGGQQQRVALARAIAPRPRLLLMDECFSSLDAGLRQQLAADVKAIIKQQGIAGMLVTHDQSEALSFGDLLGVMESGYLHQWASPQLVYDMPASAFVAGFMAGRVAVEAHCETGVLHTCVGSVPAAVPDGRYRLFVRPGEILFAADSAQRLKVIDRQFRGHHYFYTLQAADGQLLPCDVPAAVDPGVIDMLPVNLALTRPVLFPL